MHGIAGWRRVVLWPLVALVRVWCRTLRFDTTASQHPLAAERDEPVICVLWHNRLFAAAEVFRRFWPSKKVYALVSASKDGAWLAAFFELAGMGTVRGSSSNFGREAMHALAERLEAGDDVGITPDGPRGPAYKLKGGGVLLARKTGCKSLLFGFDYDKAWRVPSWDRFYLPVPWSTVRLSCEPRTAAELSVGTDPVGRMETDMVRLNPDPFAPSRNPDKARTQVV